jgi:hypothetical protein
MLQFNPFLRPSAAELLESDFFENLKESYPKSNITPFNFTIDPLPNDATLNQIK